jgi:type II secretory pathway pseudopilin PulG
MAARSSRIGVTLMEVLAALAIIAVLIGLLVVAVVRVREQAVRTESENKLRQIMIATHNFAGANNGRLPTVDANEASANPNGSLFVAILPFLDHSEINQVTVAYGPIALYISPADPTASAGIGAEAGFASYAANAQVFIDNPRLPGSIPDGASNTIAFAEHYGYGCGGKNTAISFYYWMPYIAGAAESRATFAEDQFIWPVTSGNPPVSIGSSAGVTFQVAPTPDRCNPFVAQTPHPSGMLVALLDGSVRTLAPNISESTYWAAVTPAGADPLGDDWNQ